MERVSAARRGEAGGGVRRRRLCDDRQFALAGLRREGQADQGGDGGYNNDVAHAKNFLDCMRSRGKPNADLETVGHPSSLLCHIGNAAWRAGRTLRFDPATYTFAGDADANQYLTRAEYRKPWLLPKLSEL